MKLISDLIDEFENDEHEIWMSVPASDESIAIAEKSLGVSFSPQYRKFLTKYGSLSIETGNPIIGIIDNDPLKDEGGNILSELKYLKASCNKLPAGVIPIHRHEDGAYCFDFRGNNKNVEPPIVNMENSFNDPQQVSSCFLEFLLNWVIAPELGLDDFDFHEYSF
jgi:hypothetical protein